MDIFNLNNTDAALAAHQRLSTSNAPTTRHLSAFHDDTEPTPEHSSDDLFLAVFGADNDLGLAH